MELINFNIKISDLANNMPTNFDFIVENNFFASFEDADIQGGNVKADLILTRNNSDLLIEIIIDGYVSLICDRCLEIYQQNVYFEDEIFINTINFDEKNDTVILFDKNKFNVNVARLIYDSVLLSLPIKHTHSEDENDNPTCNPSVLENLKKYLIN